VAKKQVQDIRKRLFQLQDEKYKEFQEKLLPTIEKDSLIGTRTPELRKLAKELMKAGIPEEFLEDLPHEFFDENQLHAFIISEIKDFEKCLAAVNSFLPFINNWATCDQLSPKVFKKYKQRLIEEIRKWIRSGRVFTIRFAIGMLMQHFLDEDFKPEYPEMVARIRSREYYVNMMIAWYFATALAKQPEAIMPYFRDRRLEAWTHNKAIQKAIESYRIPQHQKDELRKMKIKMKEKAGPTAPDSGAPRV